MQDFITQLNELDKIGKHILKNYSLKAIEHFLIGFSEEITAIKPKNSQPKRKRITRKLLLQVLIKSNYRCVTCNAVEDLEVDHIIPFSKGGSNDPSNLQILCRLCNLRKYNKL